MILSGFVRKLYCAFHSIITLAKYSSIRSLIYPIVIFSYFLPSTIVLGQKVNGFVKTNDGAIYDGKINLKAKSLKVRTFEEKKTYKISTDQIEDVFLFYDDEIVRYHYVRTSIYGNRWLMFFDEVNGKKIYRDVDLYKFGKNKLYQKWYYFGLNQKDEIAIWLHVTGNDNIFFKNNLIEFFSDNSEITNKIETDLLTSRQIVEIINLYKLAYRVN
jgi:hypothetical protein